MPTGADIVIQVLQEEGVEVIFGYPGANTLPINDRLMDSPIRHYTMRHEQAAAHAADGYARVTGKVGVCLSTSGPGATNLVTGIATAFMDSIPLVALTAQVNTDLLGRDAFQETDIMGITMPITKHSFQVNQAKNLASNLRQAFYLAATGRPGPILVDLPKDVLAQATEPLPPRPLTANGNANGNGRNQESPQQLEQIARALNKSERPVVIVGGGVKLGNASLAMVDFLDRLEIPFVTSMMGLDAVPTQSPLYLGFIGTHGLDLANRIIHQADFILAVGTRFTERTTPKIEEFAPLAQLAQIDIDPTSIGKNIKIDFPYIGDIRDALEKMNPILETKNRDDWRQRIARERDLRANHLPDGGCGEVGRFLSSLQEALPEDTIVVADVGLNQIWTLRSWKCRRPRSILASGGMGTMGFSLPAAIGAQVALPNQMVVSISGDGGFLMNVQELATVGYYGLPLKIVVLNNGNLGMVRQIQDLFYQSRFHGIDLGNRVDLPAVARGFGIPADRVSLADNPAKGIEAIKNSPGPYFLEVIVDPDQYVYPIIGPGGNQLDMIYCKQP